MPHVMIDIETLSTEPNALILTIGALWFDPHSDAGPYDGFHVRVDIDTQDRHVCDETLSWWSQQAPEIQAEAFNENDRIPLSAALKQLAKFVENAECVWAHGTTFDIIILENAYKQCEMKSWIPWKYHQVRDSRTLLKVCNVGVNREEGAHNALSDCYFQAVALQEAFRRIAMM